MYLTLLSALAEHSSVFFYKPLPWGPCSYHGFLFGRISLLHRTGIRSVSTAIFSHCGLKNTKDIYAEVKNYGFISSLQWVLQWTTPQYCNKTETEIFITHYGHARFFYPTLVIMRKKLQTRHTFKERHRSSELRTTFIHVVVSVHNDPWLLERCLIHQSTPTSSC